MSRDSGLDHTKLKRGETDEKGGKDEGSMWVAINWTEKFSACK